MREGWEYKKLEEVCEIICGQDYKNVESPDGKYPIYGTGGIMGYANQFKCPAYSIIVGRKGSINNPLYVEENFWNVDTAFGIVPSKESLSSKFFYYYCKKYDFTKHNVAVTIPSLRRIDLLKIPVPVPPLSEQQRIVSELDLLSSIIEKKKAQLKEYDQLAQSIFYDMFGDPVANEKGWEVKKLGDCCNNCDSLRKPITAKDRIKGTIPYYGASGIVDYVKDYLFDGEYLLISEDGANLVFRSTPIAFRIKGKTWVNNHAHVLQFDTLFQQIFMEYSINLRDISSIVTGCAQPKLTQAAMNNINIPYPPLPLQQSFASKIEAIERQKALIQQSIAEVQMLFDSRMDDWFA